MPKDADRVAETSTTTGTGSLALSGATGGHQTFLSAFGPGSTAVYYSVIQDGSGEWETGIGTFISASNVLQRDVVHASSAGGSKINFPTGTKIAYVTVPADGARSVLNRRPGDIGLDMIPAAGQSVPMIRVRREDGGDGFTVNPTGSMRSGRIDIVASGPTLQISDTDETLPAGRWRLRGAGGKLTVERSTSGNFAAHDTVLTIGTGGIEGINLGSTLAPSGVNDVSRHLSLWGSTYGLGVTSARLNYNAPTAARHDFYLGSTLRLSASQSSVTLWGNDDAPPTLTLSRDGVSSWLFEESGGTLQFVVDSTQAARIIAAGTGAGTATVVITREKGDARYAPISSSRRWKRDIRDAGSVDLSAVPVHSYVMERDGHPMQGRRTVGFIVEDVVNVAPEAVIFDAAGRPSGLDPLAMIALVTADFRIRFAEIETRLEGIAHGRQARSRKRV